MRRTVHHDRSYGRGFVSARRAQEQMQQLAYLQSAELVTPCRLFFVLIVSVVMVVLLSLSIGGEQITYSDWSVSEHPVNLTRAPYHIDYESLRQTREDMLLHYGHTAPGHKVEKRSGLLIEEFWDLYDGKWPVIVTDVVPGWRAYKNWGKEFFLTNYASDRIVLKAVEGVLREGVAHIRDMKTFISLLEQPVGPNAWTYMEDEMFLMLRPELRQDIGENYIIEENFFNLLPYEVRPWDCMMLWGTKYSRSTLHMDPYNWTAVNAVIWGRKKWKTSPLHKFGADQDENANMSSQQCRACIVDAFEADYWKYPNFRKTEYLEVEQNSGEMLIIPSGWFHQAYNDEETLSVSMELMNRNNYLVILEEIIRGKNLSRKKIPAHFHTLLPPDQVKLFMSLLPEKILKHGKRVTDDLVNMLDVMRNRTADIQHTFADTV